MTDISMNREAEESFLLRGRIMSLATVNKDGTPHVIPIWYLYENGKFYVETHANSVKARNISRNGNVAIGVDVGENYYDLKNVLLKGKAKVLEDKKLVRSIREKIMVKYFGSSTHPQAQRYLSDAGIAIIEIEPTKKRISQDYSKLKEF